MKHIFYLITILPILWELMCLVKPVRAKKFKESVKALKGKPFEEWTNNQRNVTVLNLMYLIWIFVGLFSGQWVVFLIILLLSFVPKKFVFMIVIDSFVTLCLLIFLIINAYHLKIDLYLVVKGFLMA